MSNTLVRTFDGSLVDPFDLQPKDLKPLTILHSLSLINRFTGHTAYPYSVGQHTKNLVKVVPEHLKRAALVHDFAEFLFNDLASPVKGATPAYKEAEKSAGLFIARHFGVPAADLQRIKWYDRRIYVNERDTLFEGKIHTLAPGEITEGLNLRRIPDALVETHWAKVRDQLILLWMILMPEYDLLTGEKR